MAKVRTKRRRNIAENINRLSRAHHRYRQSDDRQTEREREFTFAKKVIEVVVKTAIFNRLARRLVGISEKNVAYISYGIVCVIIRLSIWYNSGCGRQERINHPGGDRRPSP